MRLVVKGDVKGSIEALRGKLEDLSNEEVKVKLLHTAVGGISESDVLLAEASGALVLGFNVVADGKARAAAEAAGVEIRTYQVIYELLEDLQRAVEGMLPKEIEEVVTGHAEVRAVFQFRKSKIAGCMVTDGVVKRASRVRLTRNGRVVLNDGELDSLRRFKDDAKEVREGFECGLKIDGYDDIKEGDVIEFYELEEKTRQL
jgi:translation initiation factor IF-2